MNIQIKNFFDSSIIFKCEADSMGTAVEMALAAKANLRGADLSEIDLSNAILPGADLSFANLSGSNLRSADLHWATLCEANLRGADLRKADLSEADLRRCDLFGAKLCGANLYKADLFGASLTGADLRMANVDRACWPLACGSRQVKVDLRIFYQLVAHLCILDCDDMVYRRIQKSLLPFARKCHRWPELQQAFPGQKQSKDYQRRDTR